ncbi:MAG: glucosamine-6-phosphate deaminase [Planctomycetaceae bacterium]
MSVTWWLGPFVVTYANVKENDVTMNPTTEQPAMPSSPHQTIAKQLQIGSQKLVDRVPEPLKGTLVPLRMFDNYQLVARYVANEVAALIRQCASEGRCAVLGLPTGSTPIAVYQELIRQHREEGLDFSGVVTFNLDEYFPISPSSIHSYDRWMRENFFDHVNVPNEQIHIPRGDISRNAVDAFCREYERKIQVAGGIDLQLLGIGRTGHVGFNEPGSCPSSRTRLVNLDPVTRKDAASDFFGEEHVPPRAITMGLGTILSARRIMLMALGENKSKIVQKSVEAPPTSAIAASFLQEHPAAEFVVDAAAAAALTAVQSPWLVDCLDWTPAFERRAVIWLAQTVGKPILKLESKDFHEHHLSDLVHESGPIEHIRQRVFDHLAETICTTPGNSPSGTTKQTIVVFSPHPDDDVISMGGTLITLAEQGHDVHVAYMTSGNIAVFDHDAARHLDFVSEYLRMFGIETPPAAAVEQEIRDSIVSKKSGAPDHPAVQRIKGLIRQTEAVAAARMAGVPAEKCHFLDLPFYQTGEVRKRPIGPDDVARVVDILEQLRPGQIYLAGDLSDPHGTHRVCAQAILQALREMHVTPTASESVRDAEQNPSETSWFPEVWLYRGAWQEYEPHEIDRSVPLSPETSLRKKLAIFRHESQKDAALFPGHDEREFWVRAAERTARTARLYNELGLPEFFAIESFQRWDGREVLS